MAGGTGMLEAHRLGGRGEVFGIEVVHGAFPEGLAVARQVAFPVEFIGNLLKGVALLPPLKKLIIEVLLPCEAVKLLSTETVIGKLFFRLT